MAPCRRTSLSPAISLGYDPRPPIGPACCLPRPGALGVLPVHQPSRASLEWIPADGPAAQKRYTVTACAGGGVVHTLVVRMRIRPQQRLMQQEGRLPHGSATLSTARPFCPNSHRSAVRPVISAGRAGLFGLSGRPQQIQRICPVPE
jgi:hypothetical protein